MQSQCGFPAPGPLFHKSRRHGNPPYGLVHPLCRDRSRGILSLGLKRPLEARKAKAKTCLPASPAVSAGSSEPLSSRGPQSISRFPHLPRSDVLCPHGEAAGNMQRGGRVSPRLLLASRSQRELWFLKASCPHLSAGSTPAKAWHLTSFQLCPVTGERGCRERT